MAPSEAELNVIRNCLLNLAQAREHLADVSCWMRLLWQRIAMRSNREYQATGRFFEERYKAIRLIDEASIRRLQCLYGFEPDPSGGLPDDRIERAYFRPVPHRFDAAATPSRSSRTEVLSARPSYFPESFIDR